MKIYYYIYLLLLSVLTFSNCSDFLDTRVDTLFTKENIDSDYRRVRDFGYAPYTDMIHGFGRFDNNIAAAISDEAVQTLSHSQVQLFNEGSYNQYNNPDNVYSRCYRGIRSANYFLEYSPDYKNL